MTDEVDTQTETDSRENSRWDDRVRAFKSSQDAYREIAESNRRMNYKVEALKIAFEAAVALGHFRKYNAEELKEVYEMADSNLKYILGE